MTNLKRDKKASTIPKTALIRNSIIPFLRLTSNYPGLNEKAVIPK